jgi:hypothetical protein
MSASVFVSDEIIAERYRIIRLLDARFALGWTGFSFPGSIATGGTTPIGNAHIVDLRNALR